MEKQFPTPMSPPKEKRVLKQGMHGSDVLALQNQLRTLGYYTGKSSGYFGPVTRNAVVIFQRTNGLKADGIVGPKTYAELEQNIPIPSALQKVFAWRVNPQTMALTTPAVDIVAPVWFSVSRHDDQMVVDVGNANIDYVKQAHNRGYEVWGTVQSFILEYTREIVSNPTTQTNIIHQLVDIWQTYELDGINIDFENMYIADINLYTQFIHEFATALRKSAEKHSRKTVLSINVTPPLPARFPPNQWSGSVDREALSKIADYMIVMAYDEHWYNSPTSGPVASLPWVKQGIDATLKEVPKEKLLLGIPFYTFDWVSAPDPNNPLQYTREKNAVYLSMADIHDLVHTGKYITPATQAYVQQWLVKPIFLPNEGVTYMRFLDTTGKLHEIWAEDERAVAAKIDLAQSYDLPGIAIWEQSQATPTAWQVVAEKMGK